jgi:thioredoxin reductase (NADPH)
VLKVPFQLKSLGVTSAGLQSVSVVNFDGQEDRLEADALLPLFGFATDLGPLKNFGLTMTDSTIEVDPISMATSQPGIYAIGDVAGYRNKQKLIVTGFAEAMTAARSAFDEVFPNRTFRFQHSTDRGVPMGFA